MIQSESAPAYTPDAESSNRADEEAILAKADAILAKRYMRHGSMLHPQGAKDWLKAHLGSTPYEVFGVIYLDQRHRIIAHQDMFRGTIGGASVYPREVVAECIKHNAAAVVLYHQHPSGDTTPSACDKVLTMQIKHALELFDIRVIEHIVVGETAYSFAENGLL
ncbi:hypothetical protein B1806_04300 [Metallibacterium scheffleri]|uniref:MPN domain-containing protein n=3 Tax=Metallibacterium scheffleri TaxID=993689 RepID=A0A4S3KT42_9GAMM|nr:hypothetical protein B1806_04300 [Metallibacterium scheffleri]